jgi:hypothetical protein
MTYTKPHVVVLGAARPLIGIILGIKASVPLDGSRPQYFRTPPAYDLDG